MKRAKLTICVVLILYGCTAFAQDNCVSKDKLIADAYYGYPYVVGSTLKRASTGILISVNNTNHIGVKFEYMISDNIGLGVDYTYAKVTLYESDIVSSGNTFYGNFWSSLVKQRFLVRMNVHFATTDKIDPYAAFGAGFKQTAYKNNYPAAYVNDFVLNIFPVGFRIGVGMRYFFLENFGVNIEGGIGGPIMQGGLSFKF